MLQVYLENFKAVDVEDTDVILLMLLLHRLVDSLGSGRRESVWRGGQQERGGDFAVPEFYNCRAACQTRRCPPKPNRLFCHQSLRIRLLATLCPPDCQAVFLAATPKRLAPSSSKRSFHLPSLGKASQWLPPTALSPVS